VEKLLEVEHKFHWHSCIQQLLLKNHFTTQLKRQSDVCLWVIGFLIVSLEPQLNQFRLC
jgi:hypothetical protein